MEAIVWLVLFLVFLVFEIVTLGLTTIWFAAGAIVAFVLAIIDLPLWLQMIAFLIVSVITLVVTRPLAQKYINKNTVRTNVDELIGKIVKCTESIDNINEMGLVRINGNDWMARTIEDGMSIPKDALVQVVEIQGVKAIVQPINYVKD